MRGEPEMTDTVVPPNITDLGTDEKAAVFGNWH